MKEKAFLALLLLIFFSGCLSSPQPDSFKASLPFSTFPSKYTCDGEDISPPIHLIPPKGACCYAIYVYDETTPHKFVHWIAWNVYPNGNVIPEGVKAPSLLNDFGRKGYGGPCPPSGEHLYVIEVYALPKPISPPPSKEEAQHYFSELSIAKATLKATYRRNAR